MDDDETPETCEDCGRKPGYGEGVHLGLSETVERFLCAGCANTALAREVGIDFEPPHFVPLTFEDAEGEPHRFEFVTHLVPMGIAIYAHEVAKDGLGYQFEALGDFDADPLELFRSVYDRIRRELGRRHLEVEDGVLRMGRAGIVRARIQHDAESDEGAPRLVIDGRPVSWDAFGRMLLTYEGWQFKLEIGFE